MGFDVPDPNVPGRFFQKGVEGFDQISDSMDENEGGCADGEDGVNEGEAGEPHNQRSRQYHHPAQDIFQHMELNGLLVQ